MNLENETIESLEILLQELNIAEQDLKNKKNIVENVINSKKRSKQSNTRRESSNGYLDAKGNNIEVGDTVEWTTATKFNTTGGTVTKLSNTTVWAYDKALKKETWKKRQNCIVVRKKDE